MPITIDKAKAIELLEQAVAAKGADYVYPKIIDNAHGGTRCQYLHDGKPSCLIGCALFYALPSLEMLELLDDQGAFDDEMPSRLTGFDLEFTEEAQVLFETAQGAQDSGTAWGQAVEYAKKSVDELIAYRHDEES